MANEYGSLELRPRVDHDVDAVVRAPAVKPLRRVAVFRDVLRAPPTMVGWFSYFRSRSSIFWRNHQLRSSVVVTSGDDAIRESLGDEVVRLQNLHLHPAGSIVKVGHGAPRRNQIVAGRARRVVQRHVLDRQQVLQMLFGTRANERRRDPWLILAPEDGQLGCSQSCI